MTLGRVGGTIIDDAVGYVGVTLRRRPVTHAGSTPDGAIQMNKNSSGPTFLSIYLHF